MGLIIKMSILGCFTLNFDKFIGNFFALASKRLKIIKFKVYNSKNLFTLFNNIHNKNR